MDNIAGWIGWVLFLLFLLASLFRGGLKFDINEWQKERRQRKRDSLRALCPHAVIQQVEDKFMVRSTYISPPLVAAFQCQLCGHVTHDQAQIQQELSYWSKNSPALLERIEKINKLGKKL